MLVVAALVLYMKVLRVITRLEATEEVVLVVAVENQLITLHLAARQEQQTLVPVVVVDLDLALLILEALEALEL